MINRKQNNFCMGSIFHPNTIYTELAELDVSKLHRYGYVNFRMKGAKFRYNIISTKGIGRRLEYIGIVQKTHLKI